MENIEASEKLKLSAENLNSVLSDSIRKISATKKRTKKLKAVSRLRSIRKKKEKKLEIPSFLKNLLQELLNKYLHQHLTYLVIF